MAIIETITGNYHYQAFHAPGGDVALQIIDDDTKRVTQIQMSRETAEGIARSLMAPDVATVVATTAEQALRSGIIVPG